MTATKIMLIRHAEKPNGEPGIMPDRSENPEALTPTGWKRADALLGLFDPPNGAAPPLPLARPMSLFASGSESLRPKQTLAPLAAALSIPVTAFSKGEEDQLVAAVKTAEGPALISWQHEAIPLIATLIRGSPDGVPQKWPGRRFDLVWVFDLQGNGAWSFAQAPQLLLPADSAQPIG
jgi:broad specificity phosphatase PhoE